MYDCPSSDWRNPDEFADRDENIEYDADRDMDDQADAWNARMTGQDCDLAETP